MPLFEFQQPFDGSQVPPSHTEQVATGRFFGAYVDEKLLECIPADQADISLARIPIPYTTHDGQAFLLMLGRNDNRPTRQRIIRLDAVADSGRGYATEYVLGQDAVVRRQDISATPPADAVPMDSLADTGHELTARLRDRVALSSIETSLGYNNQPVRIHEIAALAGLVNAAVRRHRLSDGQAA